MINTLLKISAYMLFNSALTSQLFGLGCTIKFAFSDRPDWIVRDGEYSYPFDVEWGNMLFAGFYVISAIYLLLFQFVKGMII